MPLQQDNTDFNVHAGGTDLLLYELSQIAGIEQMAYHLFPQEQYMFVYNAVRELLLLGDTAIKTHDLKNAASQLKRNGGGRASYQQQFAVSIVINMQWKAYALALLQ